MGLVLKVALGVTIALVIGYARLSYASLVAQ